MLQKLVQNQILIADDGGVATDAGGAEDAQEFLMWGLEGEDVDDALHELVVVLLQKLGDHFIVVLQDFVESGVYGFLLQLNRVVEDYAQPVFADVYFGDGVVFDDLPDEVIGCVEDLLELVVFAFFALVYFL